jgi:hypothetical protein
LPLSSHCTCHMSATQEHFAARQLQKWMMGRVGCRIAHWEPGSCRSYNYLMISCQAASRVSGHATCVGCCLAEPACLATCIPMCCASCNTQQCLQHIKIKSLTRTTSSPYEEITNFKGDAPLCHTTWCNQTNFASVRTGHCAHTHTRTAQHCWPSRRVSWQASWSEDARQKGTENIPAHRIANHLSQLPVSDPITVLDN